MVRVRFRRWAFDANPAETSQIYAIRAQRGAPCPCPWCRNFCSVREREEVFPEEIRLLFGELGIDYRGEVELLSPGPRATGLYGYTVWFPFVGKAFIGPDAVKPGRPGLQTLDGGYFEPIRKHFSIGFTAYPQFSADLFDDRPTLEAVVAADVRWILDEPEPSE